MSANELLENAIIGGNIEKIDAALSQGADINLTHEVFEIKGPHYLVMSYPLWLAITESVPNCIEVVDYLLSKGAKPSNYKTPDLAYKGSTLIAACKIGGERGVNLVEKLLTAGADPNEGRGALYSSIPRSYYTKQEYKRLESLLGVKPKVNKQTANLPKDSKTFNM